MVWEVWEGFHKAVAFMRGEGVKEMEVSQEKRKLFQGQGEVQEGQYGCEDGEVFSLDELVR